MPAKSNTKSKSKSKGNSKSKYASFTDDEKKQFKLKLLRGLVKPTPEQKAQYAEKVKQRAEKAKAKSQEKKIAKKRKVAPFKTRTLMPKEATYETTLHIGRLVRSAARKERAARAIRQIKRHVRTFFGTPDVRFDPELNKFLFSQGMTSPPRRVRVRMERRVLDTEGTKSKHYFVRVSNVLVDSFHGLQTQRIEEKSENEETAVAQ